MKFCFDSVDEIKAFVAMLKGTRGKKGEGDETETQPGATGQAPAPIMPPPNAPGSFAPQPNFAPQAQPQGFNPGGFAPQAQPGAVDPAGALAQRIATKIDWALTPAPQGGGQAADQTLNWFRGRCGAEAANATLDQIKQYFLPRLPVASLEEIAKLMNAT